LYGQIEAIKSARLSKPETAKQINKLLIDANLCTFIDGTEEDLVQYASDLGIPITRNSNKNVICYLLLGTITTDIHYTIIKVVEKEYFNPDKKGLPDKLSDLTPPEIANIINQNLVQLNGPMYGALLIPKDEFTQILGRTPPVFLLLGDYHVGNKQCKTCPMGTCYSLYKDNPTFYKFLSKLAKDFDISIDLFLEKWIGQEERGKNVFRGKSTNPHNSALIESTSLLIPCTGQRKENKLRKSCFFTEFRTHNSDTRKIHYSYNEKYDADVILGNIKADTMLSARYPGFNVYQELLSLYSAEDNVETINLYFNSPFFKEYSRTLHEFYQLPPAIRAELMEGLHIAAENNETEQYMICRDSSIRKKMVTALKDFIRDNSESNEAKLKVIIEKASELYELSLGSILIDIYTLSRALKKINRGLQSQLSVVYQGNAHIQNQILLLENYYDIIQIWEGDDSTKTKCIYRQIEYHPDDEDEEDEDS